MVGQNGVGMMTGCVLPNLSWTGYIGDADALVMANKMPQAYSPQQMYDDAKTSGAKYAMVNIAEFDCPGCQNSADQIGMGGAAVVAAGGVVVEVLMTSGFVSPPTMTNLTQWIGNHSIHVNVVGDFSTSLATNNTLGRRDQAYIIDLTTMKVIKNVNGSIINAGANNSGQLGLNEMHTLLGK